MLGEGREWEWQKGEVRIVDGGVCLPAHFPFNLTHHVWASKGNSKVFSIGLVAGRGKSVRRESDFLGSAGADAVTIGCS